MSEENKEVKTTLAPLTVSRNGVSIQLTPIIGSRGKFLNVEYRSPNVGVTVDDLINYANWKGIETTIDILQADANKRAQGWHGEATDEKTGTFDEAKFLGYAQNDSARGDSAPKLLAKISDLSQKLVDITDSFGDEEGASPARLQKINALSTQMKALRKELAEKKAKTEEDKAAEAALEEKD